MDFFLGLLSMVPILPEHQNDDQLKFVFLPEDFTNQKLHELCCLLEGYLSCNIVRYTEKNCGGRRHMIGKCNRLGFVQFASPEYASRAAAWFAKMKKHLGTGILIEEYSPERNVKEVQVHVALPHDPQFSAQVVVRGIPLDWTTEQFQRYFRQYGELQRATLGESRHGNRFRTGYVLFTLLASAERAVQDHKRRTSGQPHGLQVQHKHR